MVQSAQSHFGQILAPYKPQAVFYECPRWPWGKKDQWSHPPKSKKKACWFVLLRLALARKSRSANFTLQHGCAVSARGSKCMNVLTRMGCGSCYCVDRQRAVVGEAIFRKRRLIVQPQLRSCIWANVSHGLGLPSAGRPEQLPDLPALLQCHCVEVNGAIMT